MSVVFSLKEGVDVLSSKRLKLLLGAILLGFSLASSAATVNPSPTDMVLNVTTDGQETFYAAGGLDADGEDVWAVNLLSDAGLTVNISTAQSLAGLQLDDVQLFDSANNPIASSPSSVITTVLSVAPALTSTISIVTLAYNNLLAAGTYYLKIHGDPNLSYSGTVSAVPLPGAAILFGTALLGVGALVRRRRGGVRGAQAPAV